jgi:hypothetical protein
VLPWVRKDLRWESEGKGWWGKKDVLPILFASNGRLSIISHRIVVGSDFIHVQSDFLLCCVLMRVIAGMDTRAEQEQQRGAAR